MGTFDSIYQQKIRQLQEENMQLRHILEKLIPEATAENIYRKNVDLPPDPEATELIKLGKAMKAIARADGVEIPGMTPEERERRRQARGSELKVKNAQEALRSINPLS